MELLQRIPLALLMYGNSKIKILKAYGSQCLVNECGGFSGKNCLF
jgi:hypothetical protein